MERPSSHATFMDIARTLAKRATCSRRQVGCVLVDKYNHIIGSGYNGVGKGLDHCTETPCPGAKLQSGSGLDICQAIHAEQNALLQCRDVQSIHVAYTTTSPCLHCAKLFLNTGVKLIVFDELYDAEAVRLLHAGGVGTMTVENAEFMDGAQLKSIADRFNIGNARK